MSVHVRSINRFSRLQVAGPPFMCIDARTGLAEADHVMRPATPRKLSSSLEYTWGGVSGLIVQCQSMNYVQFVQFTHREGLVDLRQVVRAVVGARKVGVQLEVYLIRFTVSQVHQSINRER